MDASEIQQVIPHRYPFLFVDQIVEVIAGKRAVGVKNVTINEPFFRGHFPNRPIMPAVLLLEAMAQVGAVALLSDRAHKGKLALFAGVDNARFRKPVYPGDQVKLEVEIVHYRGSVGKGSGLASVSGKVAAEAELLFALVDDLPK